MLFIGPLDLSVGLGIMKQFEHPKYRAAVEKIISACRKAGKSAGIVLLGYPPHAYSINASP